MGRAAVEAHLVGLDQPDARVQADLTNKCFPSVRLVLAELRHIPGAAGPKAQRLQWLAVKWEFKPASPQASKDLGPSSHPTESGEELLACSLL